MSISAAQLTADISVTGVASAVADLVRTGLAADTAGESLKALAGGAVLLAGAALIGIATKSVQMAGDFQQSMLKVQAYAGMSKDATEAMGRSILTMAPQLGIAPKALVDGLYFVASASFKGADALTVLRYAGMTAAAANVSASVTSQALVGSLNALGLHANASGQVMDILNATVQNGIMTWPEYGTAVGRVGTAIASARIQGQQAVKDFIDANAALDMFSNTSMTARQASTTLSSVITILNTKTDSIAKSASKMGISFDEARFKSMNLQQQMAYLDQITHHNTGEMLKLMGGNSMAAKAIEFLDANSKKYLSTISSINGEAKNGTTTQQMFAIAQQGLNFQIAKVKATIDSLLITLGQYLLPIVTNVISAFSGVVSQTTAWITSSNILGNMMQGLSGFFKMVSGDIQPIIVNIQSAAQAFFGFGSAAQKTSDTITSAVRPVSETVHHLQGMLGGIMGGSSASARSSPFVALMADARQVASVINADVKPAFAEISSIIGGVFAQHMKTAQGIVADLSKWFSSTLLPAIHQAMPGFQALAGVLIDTVVPGLVKLWAVGQSVVDAVLPPLMHVIEAIIPVAIKLAGIIDAGIAAALKFLMPYIIQAAQALGKFAGDVATRIAPIIENFFHNISTDLDIFMSIWNAVWPYLAPILKGVWDEIVGVIKIAWALISGIFKIALDLLSGNWSQAWTDLKDMLKGVWDGILTLLHGWLEIITGWLSAAWAGIKTAAIAGWNDLVNAITGAWDSIVAFAQGWPAQALQWGKDLIQGLINGITGMIGNVKNTIGNVAGVIKSFIHFSKPDVGPLSDFDRYAPDMMEMFARGIEGHIGRIKQAVGSVASTIRIGVQSPATSFVASGASSYQFPAMQAQQPIQVTVQMPDINLDGRLVSRQLLPHIVQQVRTSTGVRVF